jgi:hypothetical protein
MVYLAERLSDYVGKLSYEDIPPKALKNAKYRILDTIAVALAGYCTEWSRKVFEYAVDLGGRPESTIMMFGGKTNAENAALVHGTMAHSLDYDDDLAGCQKRWPWLLASQAPFLPDPWSILPMVLGQNVFSRGKPQKMRSLRFFWRQKDMWAQSRSLKGAMGF